MAALVAGLALAVVMPAVVLALALLPTVIHRDDVVNLVFVMLLSRRKGLLGDLSSGPILSAAGWFITIVVSLMSIALVITYIAP